MTTKAIDRSRSLLPALLSGVTAALGLALTIGGVELTALGGSAYYLLAGVVLIACAVLLWRRNGLAVPIYGSFLATTVAWSLVESRGDAWALAPRLIGPSVFGCLFLIPALRRGISPAPRILALSCAGLLGVLAVITLAMIWRANMPDAPLPSLPAGEPVQTDAGNWTSYGKDLTGNRFEPANQITPANVSALKLAWTYRTGDLSTSPASWEATPLEAGGALYFCTPGRWIVAVDAETGRRLWQRRPPTDPVPSQSGYTCRGVSYHAGPGTGPCAKRILATTRPGQLWALDAATGEPCRDFGTDGMVSLMTGFAPTKDRDVINTSPGLVVGDSIVIGNFVVDAKSVIAPSGVVRAFDVNTGALRWAWDMGHPDRSGAPPAGEVYTPSTPNAWAPFSADPALGLIYIPTGNPSPDFFGAYRRSFDEKYGTSLVALDIATGRPRWSFQMVHHDLWDFDLPAQPVLADVPTPAGRRAAVIQVTKTGDVFVLDRRTGAPIVPVYERAAPQKGGVTDDRLSPTQPRSALSVSPPTLRESDMWGMTPIDQMLCRIEFRKLRYDGLFTPPGLTLALGNPVSNGVFTWSGATVDPAHDLLISNVTYVPFISQLIPRAGGKGGRDEMGHAGGDMAGTPYRYFTMPMLSPLGIPCTRPPWGKILAIDLKTMTVRWGRPFGTIRDNGPLGLPLMLPITVGTPNAGGNVTTASGLIFIGATTDRFLRAFNESDGRELWRASLPAGANASPMSYVSAKSGRQFVVIAAGGHFGLNTRKGDYLLAFALPAGQTGVSGRKSPE